MAEKKKKKTPERNWTKIGAGLFIAVLCVTLALGMILTGMGTSWMTIFSSVKPGDTVTIDLTIKDKNGMPLVTSNQQIYMQSVADGGNPLYTKPLVFQANLSSTEALIPIPVYFEGSKGSETFALFGGEHDAISKGIVGMKTNEHKTIPIPFSSSMTQFWSSDQLEGQGASLTGIHVGDKLAMAVSGNETLSKDATDPTYSIRIGEVTEKTAKGVTIEFGYPSIDVTVLKINS